MFVKSIRCYVTLIYLVILTGLAFADQGAGDSFGYMWTDSNGSPSIAFDWQDIESETNIFGDSINEDLSGAISLPFPFSFYGGTARTQVYISANGWLSFTNPGGLAYPGNTSIPAGAGPNAMLAVYWDDLISSTGNGGGVYYKTEGTAPNRRFIVQWHMLNGSPTPDEIEFQVILYETSNLIKFQYNTISPVFNGGESATIGIKNNTSQGNQRSFDQSSIVSSGSAILFHNSSVSGISAGISPSSVQIGSYQSFTYTINNIVGPAGLGKLDRIAIGIPFSNIPAVTGVTMNGYSVGIQNSSSKPSDPGIATWEYLTYPGVDSVIVQTSYFEIVNSIAITFLIGIPNTTTGSYQFGSSADAELDAGNPVFQTSPSVTLTAGPLNQIRIRNGSGGTGTEVTSLTLTTDNNVTFYAAGYDAGGNFIGDQASAVWTLVGTLDQPGGSGSSFSFSPHTAPTSGSISASVGGITDATGNITVNVGILNHIRINSSSGSGGVEFGSTTLTAGQSLNLYAAGYDADNNYRSAENVNWSSTGTLDPINASGTSYTFTPTTAPSSGTVIANNGSFSDATGTITVSEGTLSYIKIRSAAGGLGSEVGAAALTADDALPLYAAGYDINNNYLGEVSASWVSTGSLDDISQTAASIIFEPVFAPSSGTIIAQVGDISDATGTITVSLGALDHIQINDAAGSGGVEVGNLNLSSGQVKNLYASGYDSDNNYISAVTVTWASTGTLDPVSASATNYTFTPVTAPTSGSITITDGVRTDTTGTITVGTGAFTKLIIRDQPGGLGTEVGAITMTTDDSQALYAASYDNSNNYLGDQSVSWLSTGNLDNINATGSNYIFDPVTASTSGQIIAQSGSITDLTGIITVQVGALDHIIITNSPGGPAVGDVNTISGQPITFYASGYDADNNYISLVSAVWASTGTLDSVNATGTSYTFTPITAPTSGTITGTSGLLSDATGTITVDQGAVSYILIRNAAGGGGLEVTSATITADQTLTVYAASYDANNNYLGDINALWATTGTLDNVQASGSSFTFNPVKAPVSGTITATSGQFIDETGTISVNVGVLNAIRINSTAGASGTAVGAVSMMTDDSLVLHSAGYDADGNFIAMYAAIWASTGTLDAVSATGTSYTFYPVTALTNGTIVASFSGFSDATGIITVSQGSVDHILITDAPNGNEIETLGLVPNQPLTLYASSYDQYDNYISLISVNWSTTGSLDNQSGSGTSFTFIPITAPTSGTILASSGAMSDETGIINVDLGTLASIIIRSSPGGAGTEFQNYNMTADDEVTLWAAGYDAGNNYLGDFPSVWSSTGTLDPVSGNAESYTFNPVTAPTSGTLSATSGGRTDQTGTITVSAGAADSLIDADNLGNTRTTIAGATQLLRVRVIDQHGNYVPGQTVSFSPASRMSVSSAVSNSNGLVETYYTAPREENSSIAEASVTGLDPLFFTVYGIRYQSYSLDPKVVSRGNTIGFSVQLSNPGNVDVPINTSNSTFSFADGSGHSFSAILSSPVLLPANTSNINLQFANGLIDNNFQGGKYTPEIQITGSGSFSNMNGILITDPAELTIGDSDITIGLVQVPDVLQGADGVTATFSVLNTDIPLLIDPYPQTRIEFRQGGVSYPVDNLQRLDGLTTLQTNVPNNFEFQFDVPAGYPVGNTDVYVILSLDNGNLRISPTDPSGSFQVLSGGNAQYVSNSLNPEQVIPRQSINFQADFENTGLADIALNANESYLEIVNSGLGPINLVGSFSLINQQTTRISFESITLPSDIPLGTFAVSFKLHGTMLSGTQIYDNTINVPGALIIEQPARLVFSNITIADDVVRQGQSNVEIEYEVSNTGDSDARVSAITHRFKKADGTFVPSTDWIATNLDPVLPNNIPAGSAVIYSVLYTLLSNAQTGIIHPAPVISYQDVKTSSLMDTSQTVLSNDAVQVIQPAAIRVEELTIIKDTAAPNAPYVNVGQTFHLSVALKNTGPDLIQTAKVRLFVNSISTPIDSVVFTNIASGTTEVRTFTQSRSTTGTVTYKVLISKALDAVGNPALIQQPVDNVQDVFVQTPSLLTLSTVLFKSDQTLDSLIVSENQVFNIRVNISNEGQSAYGQGEIVLRFSDGHIGWMDAQNPDSVKIFTSENNYIEWQLKALQAGDPGTYDEISIEVLQPPTDLNTNGMVLYTITDNTVYVSVEPIGTISNNTLNILSPQGSIDGTISTDQTFELQSDILFNSTISPSGRHAEINLPEGFTIDGGTERNLPGDINELNVEWIITAPAEATNYRTITVKCSGIDKNSDLSVERISLPVSIRVVEKAKLNLSLHIVKKQGSEDDTLSVGQQFSLQAQVTNEGTAGVTGNGKIYIENFPLNNSINPDESAGAFHDTLTFTAGTPVNWNLVVSQMPAEVISDLLKSLQQSIDRENQKLISQFNPGQNSLPGSRDIFNKIYKLTSQAEIKSTKLAVKYKDLPEDNNTNQNADTLSSYSEKTIYIENQATLNLTGITCPDTVTTGQTFSVTVEATPSENLINPVATLQLPESFGGISPLQSALNAQHQAVFNIQVPADPAGLAPRESLLVMVKGTDINSNLPVLASSPQSKILKIRIKPKLVMNHEILLPVSAVANNMLSYGQTVEINVWADTLPQFSQLRYSDIKNSGSIVLNQDVFDKFGFLRIENELYEKSFTSIGQKLEFRLRAPQKNITTSVNFSFNQLPRDKFSNDIVDVDIDNGSVKIPLSVSAKEITVTRIDSLVKNSNFTRGLDGNVLFALEISNKGYLDNLFVNSLELLFIAKNDTSHLTDLALENMLESIKVVNYEQLKSDLTKSELNDPKVYANFHTTGNSVINPLKIDFDQTVTLPPDSSDILLVIAKFSANAATRSFRTVLRSINAYDDDPAYPVLIVDRNGEHIGQSDYFSSGVFYVITDNLKEAFIVYPNPFIQSEYPVAKIRFLLKERSDVVLRIYTLLGELVRSKWNMNLNGLNPGPYDGDVFWDGTNDRGEKVLNGVYLCTIEIRGQSSTKRFITKIGYIK